MKNKIFTLTAAIGFAFVLSFLLVLMPMLGS